MDDGLTRDNPHLSQSKSEPGSAKAQHQIAAGQTQIASPTSAINCTASLSDQIEAYVQAGIAPATRRAYRADLDHFFAWGGSLPSTEGQLAAYLVAHAQALKVATLVRRLAAISVAHEAQKFANPARSPLVRATMRGIRRELGVSQRQAAPLLREDLFAVLSTMGDTMKDARDRALLLIGFAGGFRRSELVGLNLADFQRVPQGLIVTIRRSKADQESVGRKVGIPTGGTRSCPVRSLENWISRAGVQAGPIFRPIDRHGRVGPQRLSGDAVCKVIRRRLAAAGYDPRLFSGHSLRAGLVTSAAQAGLSSLKIRDQTGHASEAMLARYIRDGELFRGNVAGALL